MQEWAEVQIDLIIISDLSLELMSLRHHLTLVHLAATTNPTNKTTSTTPTTATSKAPTSPAPASATPQASTPLKPSPSPASPVSSTPNSASSTATTKPSPASPNSSNSSNTNLSSPPSQPASSFSFGTVEQAVGITVGIVAVILLITCIIVIIYRRYKARQDYNDSPQNFANRPDLSWQEEFLLHQTPMEAAVNEQKIKISKKDTISGESYDIEFSGQEPAIAFFHRRQQTTCYFEIQVLKLNAIVQIGFVPVQSFKHVKKSEGGIGISGVGVTTTGFVQAEGQNIYNYSWLLAYGDVVGIGLSQNSKFKQRRAWISKNGMLLNHPPMDEMDKWIATVEISAQQKQEYNLGKQKPEGEVKEKQEQTDETEKAKQQRQRKEAQLKKQRISLKTFNKFEYYPVIMCHGHKNDKQTTVINVNVGGQIFRMYDAFFHKGLLNTKPIFSNKD